MRKILLSLTIISTVFFTASIISQNVQALPLCNCDDEEIYCSSFGGSWTWDGVTFGQACSGGTGSMACGGCIDGSAGYVNDGYGLIAGSYANINEWGTCRRATSSCTFNLFIPTITSGAWTGFITNKPACVTITTPTTWCNGAGSGGGGGGAGGACFVAGSKVRLANGDSVNIEDVKPGEFVQTYNDKLKNFDHRKVLKTFHHESKRQILFTFKLKDGSQFTANDIHPIFIEESQKYFKAIDIYNSVVRNNQKLHLKRYDGRAIEIVSIIKSADEVPLYNLEIDGDVMGNGISGSSKNYFVEGFLVHNVKQLN